MLRTMKPLKRSRGPDRRSTDRWFTSRCRGDGCSRVYLAIAAGPVLVFLGVCIRVCVPFTARANEGTTACQPRRLVCCTPPFPRPPSVPDKRFIISGSGRPHCSAPRPRALCRASATNSSQLDYSSEWEPRLCICCTALYNICLQGRHNTPAFREVHRARPVIAHPRINID